MANTSASVHRVFRKLAMAPIRGRSALFVLLISSAPLAGGQDAAIDWWSVDAGGDIEAAGGEWSLSGTLGQWDGTERNLLTGGTWQMTGGFWAAEAPLPEALFVDSFEN